MCNTSIQNIQGIAKIIAKEIKWGNTDCTNKLGWEAKETLEEPMNSAWDWEKLKE